VSRGAFQATVVPQRATAARPVAWRSGCGATVRFRAELGGVWRSGFGVTVLSVPLWLVCCLLLVLFPGAPRSKRPGRREVWWRWSGVGAALLIAAAYPVSILRKTDVYREGGKTEVSLRDGAVQVTWGAPFWSDLRADFGWVRREGALAARSKKPREYIARRLPFISDVTFSGYGKCYLPLWIPLVMIAIPTGRAWWRLARRRRAGKRELCTECGYSLVALAAGSPCPECGATPEPSDSTSPRGSSRLKRVRRLVPSRRVCRWASTSVLAVSLLTWIASFFVWYCYDSRSWNPDVLLFVGEGRFDLDWEPGPGFDFARMMHPPYGFSRARSGNMLATRSQGVFTFSWWGSSLVLIFPLWLPAAVVSPFVALLWWRFLRDRRGKRLGFCPSCRYSLKDLAPTAPCPECGTSRPPQLAPP
jgi:hypothetical protein